MTRAHHLGTEASSQSALSRPRRLEHRVNGTAQEIVRLQRDAYAVEAALIGSDAIPPLNETPRNVADLDLEFLAIMDGEVPVAAIGYRVDEGVLDIDRLMVHPRCFRQGLGRMLVLAVLESVPHTRAVVSTGRSNAPARSLYEQLGFTHCADVEVVPGLFVSQYERYVPCA